MSQEPCDSSDCDALLERFVESLASAAPLDLEDLARSLPAAQRASFRAQALALEYLARLANGEAVHEEEYRARLTHEEERARFDQALADQAAAGRALPGDLRVGTVLDGRFEIRRLLGRGGMGSVYAAFDLELEREVALKVLRLAAGAAPPPEWEETLARESRLLARLENPSIVAIHDVRRGKEHTYLVMDLARGPDLHRVLERVRAERRRVGARAARGPGPLRAAIGRAKDRRDDLLGEGSHVRCSLRLVREIARAVEAAHAAGVVHNDLKPQNIVILPGGRPVLLDFGLGSWRAQGEQPGLSGTPEYLAPEQIERACTGNDPRTDVYQLGLVLFELLTLARAFVQAEGEDLGALLSRIQSGTRVPLRRLLPRASPELEALLERALARDPARRYAGARELGEDLERCLARLPPRHVHVPPLRSARLYAGFLGRHPATWIVLVALVGATFALRPPPWSPPKVEVFRYQSGTLESLVDGQPLDFSETCVLGVHTEVTRPTWLYAFSVFGADPSLAARRLRPVAPDLLESFRVKPPDRRSGGLRLEPGQQHVVCTSLRRPDPYEGLVVIACAQPSPLLERLQETLLAREVERRTPATWAEFEALGEELGTRLRGESLELSAAERAGVLGGLLAPGPVQPEALSARGLMRFDFLFAVNTAGH